MIWFDGKIDRKTFIKIEDKEKIVFPIEYFMTAYLITRLESSFLSNKVCDKS